MEELLKLYKKKDTDDDVYKGIEYKEMATPIGYTINKNILENLIEDSNMHNLPDNIVISTTVVLAELNKKINSNNIRLYGELNKKDVVLIKYGDKFVRSILPESYWKKQKKSDIANYDSVLNIGNETKENDNEKTKKTKRKKYSDFGHQVTLNIIGPYKHYYKTKSDMQRVISAKLFDSGKIHLSGIIYIQDFVQIMNSIIKCLTKERYIKIGNEFKKIDFLENNDNPIKVKSINISHINCTYYFGHKPISLRKTNFLIKKSGKNCCINSQKHPSVLINFKSFKNQNNKETEENKDDLEKKSNYIKILLFKQNSMLINSFTTRSELLYVYDNINKILNTLMSKILIKDYFSDSKLVDDIFEECGYNKYNNSIMDMLS